MTKLLIPFQFISKDHHSRSRRFAQLASLASEKNQVQSDQPVCGQGTHLHQKLNFIRKITLPYTLNLVQLQQPSEYRAPEYQTF